jgi:ribonuclease HI
MIKTHSESAIKGLTKYLPTWEDKGWIAIANKDLLKCIVAWARARSNTTTLHWVKGHNGELGNEEADKLAAEGALLPEISEMDLSAPENFIYTGARLLAMTQSDLYKGILETQPQRNRPTTALQLDIARLGAKDISGKLPMDDKIWKSIRNKVITRSIRIFLWKCLHGAHRCGAFWNRIPTYEHRANCPTCNVEETMEHILINCTAPGQQTIWHLTQALWLMGYNTWPTPTYGTILACGLANFKNDNGTILHGQNRLFSILISESAHLIWKLRCERRIQNGDDPEKLPSEAEVHNRWVSTINKRLLLDQLMTNQSKYGKKALKPRVVAQTWDRVLLNRENLPRDWIRQSGVLVGMRPQRPPGHNR